MLDPRAKKVVAAEQLGGGTHLAQHDKPPDSRAADRCPSSRQRGGDRQGESLSNAQPAKECRVAPAALAESEVLADDDVTQLDSARQALHECRRAETGHLGREGDDNQVLEAELIK